MDTPRFILAMLILLCAVCAVALNWGCVIASIRNKRHGIDRHHSTVPVVSFILVGLAHVIYPRPDKHWMILIPVLDIGNWSLLALPFVLFREWRTQNTEPNAPPNSHPRPPLPTSPKDQTPDSLRTPSSGGCG